MFAAVVCGGGLGLEGLQGFSRWASELSCFRARELSAALEGSWVARSRVVSTLS